MFRVLALSAAVALFASTGHAAEPAVKAGAKPDIVRGQKIATQVCAACHAADGNSTISANPKLAGQFAEYLHKQLANFKSADGKKALRENAVMGGMVAGLNEDDMKALAAYYAEQKLKPAVARDKDLAAKGQAIWRGGNSQTGVPACAGCHGPSGVGMPAVYPRLSGQFAEYIEAQLKAFRAGARANDQNGMMRGVAQRMTDAEMRAVAEYAAGLRSN
jgi:cytochrome c553